MCMIGMEEKRQEGGKGVQKKGQSVGNYFLNHGGKDGRGRWKVLG